MLKTILCATDGSDHAQKALEWSSELAVKYDAALIVLFVTPHRSAPPELRRMAEIEHIVEPKTPAPPDAIAQSVAPSGATAEALRESAASSATIYREIGQRVVEGGKFLAESRGVAKVTALVEDGDPAHQIIEAAKRHGADLIVMGRRGVGDLKGLLLGSVSHKVAQLASCACLTVE